MNDNTPTILNLNIPAALSDPALDSITLEPLPDGARLTLTAAYDYAFGLGECFDAVNYKGRSRKTEVYEKFCHQGKLSYCPLPFFLTGSGFGVFVMAETVTDFDFGEEAIAITLRRDSAGRLPVVTILHGMPLELVKQFTLLAGKPKLPPEWSFGVWISANRWSCDEDVYGVLEKLRRYNLPADVMVLEAWSDEATFYTFRDTFRDPEKLVKDIHGAGLKLVLWQAPVIKRLSLEEHSKQHDRDCAMVREKRLCVMREDGTPYTIPEDRWFPGSMIPDFTNPETRKWWFGSRQHLLDMGVDGFKTDGGEFIYGDGLRFSDGRTEMEMKNTYATEYIARYADFAGDSRVLFSRAGYLGIQRHTIQWAGDQASTWEELQSVVRSALSCAMSGVSLWSFDIAGFAGKLPEKELYERATQFAVFTPVMQWHSEPDGGQFGGGTNGNNERSPWNIAEVWDDTGLIDRLRVHYTLRKSLQPYIYSLARRYAEDGTPILQHPLLRCSDGEFLTGEPCYFFGDLLVYPVLREELSALEVYLPKGGWYDFFTGEYFEGGQSYTYALSPERIPVFVQSGCAIPLLENGEMYLRLYGERGEYAFSDKDGRSFCAAWGPEGTNCPDCRFERVY